MNRLQVGGFALVVGFTKNDQNVGKVVKLVEFLPNQNFDIGKIIDVWKCVGNDLVFPDGKPSDYGYFESKNLMPLGDKKTQNKLVKEKEHDKV